MKISIPTNRSGIRRVMPHINLIDDLEVTGVAMRSMITQALQGCGRHGLPERFGQPKPIGRCEFPHSWRIHERAETNRPKRDNPPG